MPVSYHEYGMSTDMSLSKERNNKRKTANVRMCLFTGMDRNGPKNRNGLPESTSIFMETV